LKLDASAIEDLAKTESNYDNAKFELKSCIKPEELKAGEKKIKAALDAYNQDMKERQQAKDEVKKASAKRLEELELDT
jgi:hypothetical protein